VAVNVLPLIVAPVPPASNTLHTMALLVALDGVNVPLSVKGASAVAVSSANVISSTAVNVEYTVKLKWTDAVAPLFPSMVIVSLCVPTGRFALGWTLNVAVSP